MGKGISMKASTSLFDIMPGHNHHISLQKYHNIPGFGVDSQSGKWSDSGQEQPSIACEVLQTLSFVPIQGARNSCGNIIAHDGIYLTINTKNHHKIPDFCCTLSMRNSVLWCNQSHPLLLKYLKTNCEFPYGIEHIYEGIYQPL